MTEQCNPANLQILEGDSIEHFQLPQCCISSLPNGVPSPGSDSRYVSSIPSPEYDEFNNSKFFRISVKTFSDLKDSKVEDLRKHCRDAHCSEEFFVTIATDQWLRTKFMSPSGWTRTWGKENDEVKRSIIKSNVLPYDPYWRSSPAGENAEGKRVQFPCCMLSEESEGGSTLMRKLQDWTPQVGGRIEACDISKHVPGPEGLESGNIEQPKRKLWKISLDHVNTRKILYDGKGTRISQVTWRYGNFIQKQVQNHVVFEKEVKSMEMLCHPHIVYTFGATDSSDREGGFLYMEWMDCDLSDVILKNRNRGKPPFLHHDSVDILLQIAKALAYMHEKKVIHGDLKSRNIFVTEFEISKKRYRYLAKVADFGEAQMHMMDSDPFTPSHGTPLYAAPEVLKFFEKKGAGEERDAISVPEKTDVYSFSLIAFEVLTGTTMEEFYDTQPIRDIREWKQKVIYENLRPDLGEKCSETNFVHDEQLISLIKSCWEHDPSKRPPFSRILETLESVRARIQVHKPSRSWARDLKKRMRALFSSGWGGKVQS